MDDPLRQPNGKQPWQRWMSANSKLVAIIVVVVVLAVLVLADRGMRESEQQFRETTDRVERQLEQLDRCADRYLATDLAAYETCVARVLSLP